MKNISSFILFLFIFNITYSQGSKISSSETKSLRDSTIYVVLVENDTTNYSENLKKGFEKYWTFCKYKFINVSELKQSGKNKILFHRQFEVGVLSSWIKQGDTFNIISPYNLGLFRMNGIGAPRDLNVPKHRTKAWDLFLHAEWLAYTRLSKLDLSQYELILQIKTIQNTLIRVEKGEELKGFASTFKKIFNDNDELDDRILIINKSYIPKGITEEKLKEIYYNKFLIMEEAEMDSIVTSEDDKYCFLLYSPEHNYNNIRVVKNSDGKVINFWDVTNYWNLERYDAEKAFNKLIECLNDAIAYNH